ncbi:hypothetical protein [uncultured Aquimarina sp.]|uniref:hypothetical protein n=1 Tax=uncultured Aquimarina sp. TaxID=575652 RepID=UPI00263136A3|nr:hypothetical protein [uncultured Aquimarina sp.]
MNKIDLRTYKLYNKYNGQAEWEEDFRIRKPKDVYERIGNDFHIIDTISNNLFIIKSGLYSKELMVGMKKEIDELKIKLTDEVYGFIERNERIYPEPKQNFLQRVLNKNKNE